MKKKLAIEKFYKDKITKLQQDNNNLQLTLSSCLDKNRTLEKENKKLQEENRQQKEQIDKLLEYTELSKEDIKIACEKDKGLAGVYEMICGVGKSGILNGMFR
jgi:regulator of replication initiation timing